MSKEAKLVRGQLRQVAQEILPEILKSELGENIKKDLLAQLDQRIQGINEYCTAQLAAMDKRAKAVQGFIMQEVKGGMHHSMSDMDVTIQAIIEVLGDSGIVIDDFVGKVNARKPEIITARRAAAEAKMKADLEASQEDKKALDQALESASQNEQPASPEQA